MFEKRCWQKDTSPMRPHKPAASLRSARKGLHLPAEEPKEAASVFQTPRQVLVEVVVRLYYRILNSRAMFCGCSVC